MRASTMMNSIINPLFLRRRPNGPYCHIGLFLLLGPSCDSSTKDVTDESSGGSLHASSSSTTSGMQADTDAESTGESSGTAPDCERHFDRASCTAESDRCEFVGMGWGAQVTDGVCSRNDDIGWCLLPPLGGSAVPSMWHQASTGLVVALSFDPVSGPPGWVQCGTACNSESPPVEPCFSCFCTDAPDDE